MRGNAIPTNESLLTPPAAAVTPGWQGAWRWVFLGVVAVFALVFPFLVPTTYELHIGIFCLFVVSIGIAYDTFVGATGYRSFAHTAFLAISAYVTAILGTAGVPMAVTWLLGVVAASVAALVVGAISLWRVKGFTFTIVTLGFGVVTYVIANAWIDVTRGPQGIYEIPALKIGVFGFHTLADFYYGALFLAVIVNGLSLLWLRGARGRRLAAIRENEDLAEACGLNVYLTKLPTFVLSGMLMGIMGGFYAQYYTIVTPDLAWLQWMTLLLAIVVVAGPGHRIGVICASLFLVIGPEIMRAGEAFRELLSGGLMLLTVLIVPDGWTPTIERFLARRRATPD